MNMVREKGNLRHQQREKIKKIWGNLSEEEIALYNTQRHMFLQAVEKKYGLEEEQVEKILCRLHEEFEPA